ncbi:hypothetical protein CJU94_00090 [Paraburkholderia aromaticivorans]|uniref:Uncharacterized protein n=1 Tax=Paraburkholderia aromaticivorans TaxID=2026199 RepID=A0A248VCJ8_9BURK|nr:hypothetical protein CJU94_00090 [Paraburkholderia aromaticivorans]
MLAVGTQESRALGRERIDLKACLLDTDRFGDWRESEEVCSMSACRSFGIKLTNGFVVVEQEALRSLNVGSLCFNEIVKWAQRAGPDETVLPINLLAHHVGTYRKENVERRYRFYRRFGLDFNLTGQDGNPLASGESKPMLVRELICHPALKFPNIVELDLVPILQQLSMKNVELDDDVHRLKGAVSRMVKERQRIRDVITHAAIMARWPVAFLAFSAGAVLFRPGHFGFHF